MRKELKEMLEKQGIKVRLMTKEEAAETGVLFYSVPKKSNLDEERYYEEPDEDQKRLHLQNEKWLEENIDKMANFTYETPKKTKKNKKTS